MEINKQKENCQYSTSTRAVERSIKINEKRSLDAFQKFSD